mgnify:CR=1 FL=1
MADTNIRMAVLVTAVLMAVASLTLVLWGAHIGIAFGFAALWGFAFGMAPVVLPINLSAAAPDALEAAGLTPEVAGVTMRPENTIELTGEDAAKMQKLLDVLEDLDDVQAVFHNAEIHA